MDDAANRSGCRTLAGQYQIILPPQNDIWEGPITLDGVQVIKSFLPFGKERSTATTVHYNLLKLKGDRFLKSHVIIHEGRNSWLAVEKIDCSLQDFESHRRNPTHEPIIEEYKRIIRDIISGMCDLHKQKFTHGELSIKDIVIVNGRAKLAFIRNQPPRTSPPSPRDEITLTKNLENDYKNLKDVFKAVLDKVGRREIEEFQNFMGRRNHGGLPIKRELKHFLDRAKVNNRRSLEKLFFHPFLLTPQERFFLPIRVSIKRKYRDSWDNGHKKTSEAELKLPTPWKNRVRNYRDGQNDYIAVLDYETDYRESRGELFRFVRNAIVHVNDNKRLVKKDSAVAHDISSMFPDVLNCMYDYLDWDEIKPQ